MASSKIKFIRRQVILAVNVKIRSEYLRTPAGRAAIGKAIGNSLSDGCELLDGDPFEVTGHPEVFLSIKDFNKAHVLDLLAASAQKPKRGGKWLRSTKPNE